MTRRIDALVAERVMGWWDCQKYANGWFGMNPHWNKGEGHQDTLPPYSTSIQAAWEVVEKMKPTHHFNLSVMTNGYIEASFAEWIGPTLLHEAWINADEDTEEMAIALAALKAVGVTEDEIREALAA